MLTWLMGGLFRCMVHGMQQATVAPLNDSLASVCDIEFAPKHLGLKLVRQLSPPLVLLSPSLSFL